MRNPAICCYNLKRSYADRRVIDDLTLCVEKGEFVALLGESGCGKTTTLRLIAGFDRPDSGTIKIEGTEVCGPGVFVPAERRRVGMVFQEYALFPHLNVSQNIGYGLARHPDRARRVAATLELVGLQGLEKRMPHELSGGQQQRVALARALAPEPDLILLDEPFSNLDAGLRVRLREEVRHILRQIDATAIFVTHDQEEALAMADRVAIMHSGKILQIARPDVLYRFPATREIAAFVGEANFLPGEALGDHVVCSLGRLPLPLCKPARGPVDVLLRPEWIEVVPMPGEENEVIDRMYFGHDQLMTVRLPDGRLLKIRLGPYQTFQPGDRVRLMINGPVVTYPRAEGQAIL